MNLLMLQEIVLGLTLLKESHAIFIFIYLLICINIFEPDRSKMLSDIHTELIHQENMPI